LLTSYAHRFSTAIRSTPFLGGLAVDALILSPIVAGFAWLRFFLIMQDPVLHAVDPWVWASIVDAYSKLHLDSIFSTTPVLSGTPIYPKAFPILATLIKEVTGASAYETIRFYPIISSLNLIPTYFLSFEVTKSRRVAVLSAILLPLSRWYSIRTSIANPETFTHFWLLFSLLFLLRLEYEPKWRNAIASSFFITMTVMFWHFPIVIYAIFFTLLTISHFKNRLYIKKLFAVGASSITTSGLLWYFWVQPFAFLQQFRLAALLTQYPVMVVLSIAVCALISVNLWSRHKKSRRFALFGKAISLIVVLAVCIMGAYYLISQSISHYLFNVQWGYLLPMLVVIGLALLAPAAWRAERTKIFLLLYLASLLILVVISVYVIQMETASVVLAYYVFSSLSVPLSIIEAVAVVGAIDVVMGLVMKLRGPKCPSAAMKWARALALIALVILAISANSSVDNYGGQCTWGDYCSFSWPFESIALLSGDSTIQLGILGGCGQWVCAIMGNEGAFTNENIITFQYAKSLDAPFSTAYDALGWIRNHSSQHANVVVFLDPNQAKGFGGVMRASQGFGAVMSTAFTDISERKFINGMAYADSLMRSPTDFMESILNATHGDAYFVIGILSWIGEKWTNPILEARFLDYARARPDLFPQVYSEAGLRVFHLSVAHAAPPIDDERLSSAPTERFTELEAIWQVY
jgi:hypothetical protein